MLSSFENGWFVKIYNDLKNDLVKEDGLCDD
jgi:hypothetical protein